MPLFGENFHAKHEAAREARRAKAEAARAEDARLMALSPADLAAELMPAFRPGGAKVSMRPGPDERQLAKWLLRNHELSFAQGLLRLRVLEAVQLLEHAGLVYVCSISDDGTRFWSATGLGLAALAEGDCTQRIENRTGAAPAPPVASAVVTPPRQSIAQRLQELETLRATGAISEAEYAAKREQIIDEI
jgi:hypothetical protein